MITAETIERIVSFDGGTFRSCRPTSPSRWIPAIVLPHARREPHAHDPPADRQRDARHAARVSLRADIERVEEASQQDGWKPGTMAIFACSGAGFY